MPPLLYVFMYISGLFVICSLFGIPLFLAFIISFSLFHCKYGIPKAVTKAVAKTDWVNEAF